MAGEPVAACPQHGRRHASTGLQAAGGAAASAAALQRRPASSGQPGRRANRAPSKLCKSKSGAALHKAATLPLAASAPSLGGGVDGGEAERPGSRPNSRPASREKQRHFKSPFCVPQALCMAQDKRPNSRGRLPAVNADRCLAWERPAVEPLPPLGEIIRSIHEELHIDLEGIAKARAARRPQSRSGSKISGAHPRRKLSPASREVSTAFIPKPAAELPKEREEVVSPTLPGHPDEGVAPQEQPATPSNKLSGESTPNTTESCSPRSPKTRTRLLAAVALLSPKSSKSSSGAGGGPKPRMGRRGSRLFARQGSSRPLGDVRESNDDEAVIEKASSGKDDEDNWPWPMEDLRAVFAQFDTDTDGEVHSEELVPILRTLGCVPKQSEVEELIRQQTRYSTLSWEEFLEFVRRYREGDLRRLREQFRAADLDGDGRIDFDELHALLHDLGFAPTAQATAETLEALSSDGGLSLSFKEFQELRRHLRQTQGLLKTEVEDIARLFMKSHVNRYTNLSQATRECWRITNHLGYPCREATCRNLIEDYMQDDKCDIGLPEVLQIVRKLRDQERTTLSHLISKRNARGGISNDKVPVEDLGIVLGELGYIPSDNAIYEVLEKMGEVQDETSLTLDELASFLRAYRSVEGFTVAEYKEFEDAFHAELITMKHLRPQSCKASCLDTLALGHLLRFFGFSLTLQEVQRMLEELDFDHNEQLDFAEFIKMIRRLYQEDALRFCTACKKVGEGGIFSMKMLAKGVTEFEGVMADAKLVDRALVLAGLGNFPLGCCVDWGTTKKCSCRGREANDYLPEPLSRNKLLEFFRQYRQLSVRKVRDRAGYSATEVCELHKLFRSFDSDGSGTIERKEFRSLILELFPDAIKSKQQQEQVVRLLGDVDKDDNHELNFTEFLSLMRKCNDMRDANDLVLEKRVVQENDFTHDEVDGYRQIFSSHVNWTGELDTGTLLKLLGSVVKFTYLEAEELCKMVCGVHPHGREVVRFPQFLQLVKLITESNYKNINAEAVRIVRRETQRNRNSRQMSQINMRIQGDDQVRNPPRLVGIETASPARTSSKKSCIRDDSSRSRDRSKGGPRFCTLGSPRDGARGPENGHANL